MHLTADRVAVDTEISTVVVPRLKLAEDDIQKAQSIADANSALVKKQQVAIEANTDGIALLGPP